ncbi:protein DEHYDRATION-INDUCED 19 homolog 6-like isoform X1 [Nymphaea colorata]|nr:protein DEHYDRATION-INDUCED 19 homolog 6-like isoform X1 [Nymphaea colorata]
MEMQFWASRFHSTKHLTYLQTARLGSESTISLDGTEGDEDVRASFQCPFCYVDIEVPLLCSHLHEEHCFDVKNSVCPVCAASLGKDTIGHFTVQHPHLLKKRRKSRKGHWNSRAVMRGKELDISSANGGSNMAGSLTDPLLSPFLCSINLPDSNQNKISGCNLDKKITSSPPDAKSIKECNSNGGEDQEDIERVQRAECIQQVVMSTIFWGGYPG